jgi:hypothetical protein
VGPTNEETRTPGFQFGLRFLLISTVVLAYLIADFVNVIHLLNFDSVALWKRYGDTPDYWNAVFEWHATGRQLCILSPLVALAEWIGAFLLSLCLNRERRLFLVLIAVVVGLMLAAKAVLLCPFVIASP